MADRLAVWLYGTCVATVGEERRRLRLEYSPEALDRFPGGTPLLSLALPLSNERFGNGMVRPFLDGLLPEGDPRRAIADDLHLRADDTFGLIKALGRDCAGALVIQPDETPPPTLPSTQTAEPLTDDDLAELVGNLRIAPLGVDKRVRTSLAGVQEKLLLTRMPDGRWGRPVDGTPSTHILKPQIRGYPRTVENEAFCMRVAKHLGLSVAEVETISVEGRPLIVVTRYDRIIDAAGAVVRVHQEDFCQATGKPPVQKYQEDGGPTLRRMAGILQATDPGSLDALLRLLVLHVLVGNGDAHAKNYSLVHEPSGVLRLAPAYDVMSTLFYGDDRLAMYIDDVQRTEQVTGPRLVNEAASWGLSRSRASEMIGLVLEAFPRAVQAAAAETPGTPAEVQEIALARFRQLTTGGMTE
jgi:serine/threonine-protein kinase HipA